MDADLLAGLIALLGGLAGWLAAPAVVARVPERTYPGDLRPADEAAADDPADVDPPDVDAWPTYAEVAASTRARPVLALVTAVIWGALAVAYLENGVLLATLWLGFIGTALAWVDLRTHKLPDVLNAIALGGVVVLLALAAVLPGGTPAEFVRAMLGGPALFAFFLVLALLYPSGMGLGDVKFAGVLGVPLAWFGWSTLALGAFLGFLLGSVAGVLAVLSRRASLKTAVPFGPSMLAGALLAILAEQVVGPWSLGG